MVEGESGLLQTVLWHAHTRMCMHAYTYNPQINIYRENILKGGSEPLGIESNKLGTKDSLLLACQVQSFGFDPKYHVNWERGPCL